MNIHISRDGNEIGIFPQDDVIIYLAKGSLLHSDHAWHENLTEWVTLSDLFPPNKPDQAWKTDSATGKQIEYIRSFGVEPSEGLTKGQASELIDQLKNDPAAQKRQQELREKEQKDRAFYESYFTKLDLIAERQELEKLVSRPAQLKEMVKSSKAQIKALERQLAYLPTQIQNLKEDIQGLEEEVKEIPGDAKSLKEDIKEAEQNRIEFWHLTFTEDSFAEHSESCATLYKNAGARFKRPSKKIISDLLQELDEENFEWDRQDMLEFYRRLQEKHPELKKS
jgi:hypothetical protein